MVNIVMFGPPGAGKGTQAKLLSNRFDFAYIATGDMFRKHIKEQTSLGKLAQEYIDRGDLVPDELTINMIKEEIKKNPKANGFIFDGFPRTLIQANELDKLLNQNNDKIDAVIALEVPEDILIERILNRGKTSGRSDDLDVSTIKKRLNKYKTATEPLKKYYDDKQILHRVNGLQSIEVIHQLISKIIEDIQNGNRG